MIDAVLYELVDDEKIVYDMDLFNKNRDKLKQIITFTEPSRETLKLSLAKYLDDVNCYCQNGVTHLYSNKNQKHFIILIQQRRD